MHVKVNKAPIADRLPRACASLKDDRTYLREEIGNSERRKRREERRGGWCKRRTEETKVRTMREEGRNKVR